MMNRKFPIYALLSVMITSLLFSCNGNDDVYDESVSSSTAVTKFSLLENDKVMKNLDSVFFTIDLVRGKIYNANPLPVGTDVSKLCVSMTYSESSSAMFQVTGGKIMQDTTFAYSDEDSIDFTGDVKFVIISQDLTAKQEYSIKVNVFDEEPDSLYWARTARRDLPSYSTPIAQKTVEFDGKVYCLIQEKNRYVMSSCSDLASNRWEKNDEFEFGFEPKVSSLSATDDALYLMDTNNALYKSTDGYNWTACGTTIHSIIGSYGTRLLTVVRHNGAYKYSEYPLPAGYVQKEVPLTFPIDGVSQMVPLYSKWAVSEQRLIVGGKTPSGWVSNATWGFDGENWGLISHKGVPNVQRATLVSYYYTYLGDNNITSYQYPALLLMGGTMEDSATLNDCVYISTDNGITWNKANELLQLPEYIEDFTGAQAVVQTATLTDVRSTSEGWIEMPASKLPASIVGAQSRTIAPIESWECPYIYLFGGTNANGVLCNNIWRGVINRLSFKPLY